MQTIGVYEAKAHLSRLLDEVARRARITITKHSQFVAMLVPASPASRCSTGEVHSIDDILKDIEERRKQS